MSTLESIIDSIPIGRFQVGIILLCMVVAMADGFDTQAIALVAPEIAAAWHVPPASFGPVFGAGLTGGVLGNLVFGLAGDRFGRKPSLIVAILVFSAASLATPLTHSTPALLVVRLVTGLGLGGALPCIIAITSEYAPRRLRATLVSLMFCGFPLGAVVGGAIAAGMIPSYGWPSVFYGGAALPLALLPLLWGWLPESARFLALKREKAAVLRILGRMKSRAQWDGTLPATPSGPGAAVASLFTDGRMVGTLLLWTTLFLSLLLTYFLINWIPVVARQAGIGIQTAVLAVSALNLGAIVGCLAIGKLIDRYGPAFPIASAFSVGAVTIAMIGTLGRSDGPLLGFAFLAGLFSIGAQMCTVALCASLYETSVRATGVGWAIGIGRIGAIVGPVVGGALLASGVTAGTLFTIAGLTSFGAAIAMLAIGRFVLSSAGEGPMTPVVEEGSPPC